MINVLVGMWNPASHLPVQICYVEPGLSELNTGERWTLSRFFEEHV